MTRSIVLASASTTRLKILARARVPVEQIVARVDEDTIKESLLAERHAPRDIADALAEAKASRVASRRPDALVIGADQALDFEGSLISKAPDPETAIEQLLVMSGKPHKLHSAAVIFEDARPVWRHVATATLVMRPLTRKFTEDYVNRNWDDVKESVGCYRIEDEGVRLFSAIHGSHFAILGLPLLELLAYLGLKGEIET